MFGLIIPGRPCFADFQMVGEHRWMAQVVDKINGQSVSEMSLFILPNASMAPPPYQPFGFTIYISKDAQNWEYVDFLSLEKQSTHIHMPLSFSSSGGLFQDFNFQQTDTNAVFIGISLESMDTINNLSFNAQEKQQREQNQVQQLVQYIAKDLFNYMASFTKPIQFQTGEMKDMLIIPTNCIDTWLQKFLTKLRNNPHCKLFFSIMLLKILPISIVYKFQNE